MKHGLNIAFFGSSLVSAYWNGAATYYRGIIRALHERGHHVTFFEPDAFDRGVAQHVSVVDAEPRASLADAAPFAVDAEVPLLGDRTVAVDEAIVAVALQFLWRARLAASL